MKVPVYFDLQRGKDGLTVACMWREDEYAPDFFDRESATEPTTDEFFVSVSPQTLPIGLFSLSDAIERALGGQNRAIETPSINEILAETLLPSYGIALQPSLREGEARNYAIPTSDKLFLCTLALRSVMMAKDVTAFIRKHGYVKGPGGLKLHVKLPEELSMHA